MKSFSKVKSSDEYVYTIEKSKFICNLASFEDEEQIKNYILSIKKRYFDATHNCYAYIADELGAVSKFSDDGEPSGTAGLPIAEALKNAGLKKTVAVVTRYFGGIKLGTGGLKRAYYTSVKNCIDNASIVTMCEAAVLSVKTDFAVYSKIKRILETNKAKIQSVDYADGVTVKFAVKKENQNAVIDAITDATCGAGMKQENIDIYCEF